MYKDLRKRKYNEKKHNVAIRGKVNFFLTFDEYCMLMEDADITVSQIGRSRNQYQLARYGDQGDYKIGNCRFIQALENRREQKMDFTKTPEYRIKMSKSKILNHR